ncbi:hypothetical protein NOCA2230062 [metagenome]|uniref:Uncharacterized protein n=1 Tax=metagenome TaxID=256318 RepID=A0A2P2C340_9ZZZZ
MLCSRRSPTRSTSPTPTGAPTPAMPVPNATRASRPSRSPSPNGPGNNPSPSRHPSPSPSRHPSPSIPRTPWSRDPLLLPRARRRRERLDVDPAAAALLEATDLVQHVVAGRRAEVGPELDRVRGAGHHLEPGPAQGGARRDVVGSGAWVPGAEHVVELAERVGRVAGPHQLLRPGRQTGATMERAAARVVRRFAAAGAHLGEPHAL